MMAQTSSIAAGITQLAASAHALSAAAPTDPKKAVDRAWTILLDLGPQAVPDVQDRQHANRRAISQACVELSQQHRSAGAAKLEQLVQEWLSTTHYVSRLDAQQPASSSNSTRVGGSQQSFIAVPVSEQHAVLSLLLALRGSCPATSPVLTSLPALGSSWLEGLRQEAQAAVTSGNSNSSSSWVSMSADPDKLVSAPCAQQAGRAATSAPADPSSTTGFRSWVSPAAAAMQLLQQLPLDAAAAGAPGSTNTPALQTRAGEAPDDVLIAAACADAAAGACLPAQGRPASVLTPPLLQEVVPRMQLAFGRTSLGRPLLLPGSSLQAAAAAGSRAAATHSSGARMGGQPSTHAMPQQAAGHAVSAAAAEADAAIRAAAAVRPWVASLMQLSAAQPGSGSSSLLGLPPCVEKSSSGGGGKKDAAAAGRDRDTGMTRDVRPSLQRQQQQHQAPSCAATATGSNSSSKTRQELEAQLVSTACLALQGVWSAVQQLWQLVLHGACVEHGTPHFDRVRRPAAQHQLLVQVLHTAELRLRITAFLQHFQHPSSSSSSRTAADSSSDGSSSADAEQAIQVAFVNGVQRLLAELDSTVTTGQVKRLLQRQQQGGAVSLLQLLRVQRDLARELQQLAEVCWCTVQGYVDNTLFLSKDLQGCFKDGIALLPVKPTSSSGMDWHLLQQAQTAAQARAAAAALQGAAAAAYGAALPWPGHSEGCHAAHMGWAPSTWQLRGGIDGGYALLERLYAGVVQAGASAPLLRHLFAAAVQPVLASLHTWAFLPDTQAAEAAAEATAMASFTAGGSSNNSSNAHSGSSGGTTVGLLIASMQGTTDASTGGPFASAAAAGPDARDTSGGSAGGGSSSSKAWAGSKAAESAMRQCLQEAWQRVCARPAGCPGFLLHVQGPAGVAGMQLHLLQLLGGPGQALAERLGWLAELEQQEIQEVLAGSGSSTAAAAAAAAATASCSTAAAAAGMSAAGAAAGTFMGLLGGCGSALGVSAAAGLTAQSRPACDLSTQQLKQCVAITRDFNAAREAEMGQLLQDLAQRRASTLQAHELWLAGRQEQRQEAEAARSRLEVEAAARRRQRQQLLLAQQQEDVAAAQARRLGSRLERLSLEQHLLRQSALQEHQQAVQQLLGELSKLEDVPAAAATAAAANGHVSGFAAAAGAALPAEGVDAAVDAGSILLAEAAATAGGGTDTTLLGSGLQQQQQQQQQQCHRGTWGPPLQDLGPAAGAPTGQQVAGPLAVIGSAAAAAAAPGTAAMQAAGRRSNSQPKVLPGMGRPVSATHSRRGSEDGQTLLAAAGAGFPCGDLADADSSSTVGAGAAGAGGGAAAATAAGRAGRSSGAAGGMSSILGGGFASAFGARLAQQQQQQQQQGPVAKGKWGVPVVPGAAAGVASTLQRRASTGNLLLSDVAADSSSSSREAGQQQHQQQQQQAVLQRQPRGGLGPSSRPGTPRGRRVSDTAGWCEGAAGAAGGRQQQLQRQHSWHHMQLQLQQQQQYQQQQVAMELASHGAKTAAAAAAVWEQAALAAAAQGAEAGGTAVAAASTGWLLSRHERKREEQGNHMILGWLTDKIGLGQGQDSSTDAECTDAAGPGVRQKRPIAAAAAAAAAAAGAAVARAATYGQGEGPEAAAAASARAAAPIVSALEVLVVQPVLAQQRLTTVACWSLLLHEHQLLQRLSTIQGLFFQQQGDWVGLLCDTLEPLLQQQQQGPRSAAADSSQAQAGTSPIVLQLLLEAAVQQSCLAGVPEAERMSLQALPGRGLLGWSGSSSCGGGATDCLLLGYDVPWPVSLLLGEQQLQQYAEVFSVLLRLRRLQQQLMKQWQPLNHRASSEVLTAAAPHRRRHASEFGPEPARGSAGGCLVSNSSRGPRRSTWHGGVPAAGLGSQGGDRSSSSSGGVTTGDGDLPVLTVGLSRLQDLRRWHGLALHCVSSLLGYMLGELSGQLQGRFEAAVGSRPVELPVMLQAHARLLEEARQVCFLPQQQQAHSGGGGLAGVAYAIVARAWELQQHVAELLEQQQQQQQHAVGSVAAGSSKVLARAPSGFKEGTSCSELAAALEGGGNAEEVWESVSRAGQRLEQSLDVLRHRLRDSAQAGMGHMLAGLAARLGV